ncbi:MAG: hypothetical protein HKN68_09565 [Saprospiraceae bacterium]|nr:hypothetical protein [Saprospiraceae bacterium]
MPLKSVIFTFCFLFTLACHAQFGGNNNSNLPPPPDTSYNDQDTLPRNNNTFFDIFTGKPGKAAFYSLIVPGGGQYYNRRYWKIPLVWGIEGAAIYWYVWNDQRLDEWQGAYIGLLNDEIDNYKGVDQASTAKLLRDRYRKNKEYAYIGMILAHLLNVFDAFIDRHLIDFDVDDDIGYQSPIINQQERWMMPTFGSISIKIPLNRKVKASPKLLLGW